ncbi:hypothetical protein CWI38_0008p0140 [Hamiltosporidium tvaerminnensis]|uniref:Reverse transcriptase n=1 Tax=Hamiltosporidium tvaerminnensis TaxID=1176355 RepID=A0A4Q9M5T1_9MICR|nr:hypothetical protein CWI38_0008p0140 [Hamiltosporidium tvaerminnensis]
MFPGNNATAMPRNGWSAILRYYNGKFGRTVDIVKIGQEENGKRREYAECNVPKKVSDAARIIQAVQVCYEEVGVKISKLVLSKDLLEKVRKQEKLSNSETKSPRKIMREFNLDLSQINDLWALVKKNKSLNVYEKKVTIYESRYYRGLSERVESEHVVNRDEISGFGLQCGAKMINSKTFPLLEEFINIINWLPNRKAAGLMPLLNVAIYKDYENNIKATWIDFTYLTQCMENRNLSDLILKFIEVIISKWKIDILVRPVKIMSKKNDRGILQIDSLSPVLFLLQNSVTNDLCCEATDTLLGEIDSRGIPTVKSYEEVQTKLIARVERLCRTRLNARNLFQVINQHAISLLNYHIGVLRLGPAEFSKLDDAVRAVLVKNKIHLRPGCKERLQLPRKELRRGLHSSNSKANICFQLLDCLKKHKDTSTRRAPILKLYSAKNNELVSVNDFLRWLKKGSVRPRDEAVFCYIQDINLFWGAEGMCQHCNQSRKTVDHLATRYDIIKGSHSVQEILHKEYSEIRVKTRIKTNVKIRCNRPDIFILDKRQNRITLIEVGITSQDSLQIVETEKLRKYDLLANELGLIYLCSVEIIPYVMTWDGIGTNTIRLLRKTFETISFDRRRGLESGQNAEESWEKALLKIILGAEMHKQPIHPLKQVDNEEDDVKTENTKNTLPLILDGITTVKEPMININEYSELEEEIEVVEMVERII